MFIALRSMPAQNAPPAPVRTIERTSSSASASTQASAIPTSIGSDSAFLASGRFIVTISVWPSRSTVQCSVPPMGCIVCVGVLSSGYRKTRTRFTERGEKAIAPQDLGAGTGKLTATLVALGAEVTAVEPDAAMLAELRVRRL